MEAAAAAAGYKPWSGESMAVDDLPKTMVLLLAKLPL